MESSTETTHTVLLVSQLKVFDQVLTLSAGLAEDWSAVELVCIKSAVLFFWFFSFARAKEKKEKRNVIDFSPPASPVSQSFYKLR